MFAYITNASVFWNIGVRHNKLKAIETEMDDKGRFKNKPEDVFASFHNDEFNAQFKNTKTKHLTSVATDGIAPIMREFVDGMSKADYQRLLNWHFSTCERLDYHGLSSHMLYICKKL